MAHGIFFIQERALRPKRIIQKHSPLLKDRTIKLGAHNSSWNNQSLLGSTVDSWSQTASLLQLVCSRQPAPLLRGDETLAGSRGGCPESADGQCHCHCCPAFDGMTDADGNISPAIRRISCRYQVSHQIGQGTFGVVFKAYDAVRGHYVAVKVVRKDERCTLDAVAEAGKLTILSGMQGGRKHCVRWLTSFNWGGHYCMVADLLGDNLESAMLKLHKSGGKLSLQTLRSVAKQLCEALQFLHDATLVHADLKTENVVLGSPSSDLSQPYPVLKLIDFGCATWEGGPAGTLVQTCNYRAPEVLLGMDWSYSCDMWSVGCIVLELFEGRKTFDTTITAQHLAMIQRMCHGIPEHMLRNCGTDSQHCIDNSQPMARSRLLWPEVSGGCVGLERRWDRECEVLAAVPVEDRIPPYLSPLRLFLQRIFTVDPSFRYSARSALECAWFETPQSTHSHNN
eukprot:CAMPEP_0181307388 /NCGR_PEP_ID=MMETSP1101-20121128/10851_1 /TAXON_ID=46948 /ORGANISM="Rhodomonas abbreviata, Strain Caron Lab Isolate" /LENGTH=452 /DNA_ID=CAMNT_0023413597 /DNA_START=130 /DNA_END=1485 /DNA_ORIENTATION=+